jgi:hypothetical protein
MDDGGATAGASSAGSGGSTGSGGTTGAGGASVDLCHLPMEVGMCRGAFPAWWHDPATGVCVPFIYGGCGGNANNFPSLEACQMACSGGTPDMDACTSPGDCVLLGASCCGPCDPTTQRSFVAVNRSSATAYSQIHACGAVDCAPCPPVGESDTTRQYFIATCDAGRCRVTDVRQTDVTACSGDTDCVLRDGSDCCEQCDGHGIVSVNRNGGLEKLVCPTPVTSCPPCVPKIPADFVPTCISGRCALSVLL